MSWTRFRHVRAVLFDLDGTLVDSAPDLGLAADRMRLSRGLPSLPLSGYRPHAGSGARGMLSVAFNVAPDHASYEALRQEFYAQYDACLTEQTRAFPGVAELLAALGLTAAADYGASINSGGPTNTEMILTTTVTRGGQYIVRKTDVYYLENADTPLFMRPSYKSVNMKVVSQ